MKNTTIKRQSNWFNPYFLKGYQVQNIFFYDKTGIRVKTNWFTHGIDSNNNVPSFDLPTEDIKKKNKLVFDKNVFFYAKNNVQYFEGVNLYIPLSKIEHTFNGKKLRSENETERNYMESLTIKLTCIKTLYHLDSNKKLEYFPSENKQQEITIDYNYTSERTAYGKKVDRKTKKINSVLGERDKLSAYQVEKLMKAKAIR